MAKEKDSKEAKPKQEQREPQSPKAQKKEAKRDKAAAAPVSQGKEEKGPPPRLAIQYKEKVVPDLIQKFGYKSVMQVPRLKKITLNMGVGETTTDKKILDNAVADMRSEEHTSELQSHVNLVCRLLLEKKKKKKTNKNYTNNKNDNINSD